MKITRESMVMVAILAAAVAASVLGVYLPQSRAMAGVEQQISDRRGMLQANAEKAAAVPQIARRVRDLMGRYNNFDRRLPRSQELGGFLKEISKIQSESNLSGGRMDTQNPVTGQLYNTMPITMRQTGSYLALAEFLRQINQMARLTRVQRMMIQASRDGDPARLDIELVMNIYFTKN